jgi:hypothetical protein
LELTGSARDDGPTFEPVFVHRPAMPLLTYTVLDR